MPKQRYRSEAKSELFSQSSKYLLNELIRNGFLARLESIEQNFRCAADEVPPQCAGCDDPDCGEWGEFRHQRNGDERNGEVGAHDEIPHDTEVLQSRHEEAQRAHQASAEMQDRQKIDPVGMRLTRQEARSLQYCLRRFVRRFEIVRNIFHEVVGAFVSTIEPII